MSVANTQIGSTNNDSKSLEFVSDSLAFGIAFTILMTVTQRAVGFFRGILFCRLMSDQELGQWSMVFSFLMLLAPLAVLGLPGSFGRFVEHYVQKGQIGTFVRRIAIVSSLLTLIMASAMFLNPDFFSKLVFRSPHQMGLVNSMAFALVMVASSNFLISLVESLRQARLTAVMRFIQGVTFAIIGTTLVFFWQDSASAATFGFGLASLLCILPAAWFILSRRESFKDRGQKLTQSAMWARIAPFAIWLWASNLVWNMFEVADRYMLVHWSDCSAEVAQGLVGQYHSARVVPMLIVGVAVVLEGMLAPYMTVLWEEKKTQEAGQQISAAIKLAALGCTVCSVLILLFSPLLFNYVLAGKYDDGMSVLPATLLSSSWFSLFLFAQIYLWTAERGKIVFGVTFFGLVVNFLLNALLIPRFGLWGAVTATTTATLICLLASLIANKLCGFHLEKRIWLLCVLPTTILLPSFWPSVACGIVIGLTLTTTIFFDESEKALAIKKLNQFANKGSRVNN